MDVMYIYYILIIEQIITLKTKRIESMFVHRLLNTYEKRLSVFLPNKCEFGFPRFKENDK